MKEAQEIRRERVKVVQVADSHGWKGDIVRITSIVVLSILVYYLRTPFDTLFLRSQLFTKIVPNNVENCKLIEELKGCEDVAVYNKQDLVFLTCPENTELHRFWFPMSFGIDEATIERNTKKVIKLNLKGLPVDFTLDFHGISLIDSKDNPNLINLFIVNHHTDNTHDILKLEYNTSSENEVTFKQRYSSEALINPNSVAPVSENEFYFTNDHKYPSGILKTLEALFVLNKGSVYFKNAKDEYLEVEKDLYFPNGILYIPETDKLYVSQLYRNDVLVYNRDPNNGSLSLEQSVVTYASIDNLKYCEKSKSILGCGATKIAIAYPASVLSDQGKFGRTPVAVVRIRRTLRSLAHDEPDHYQVDEPISDDGSTLGLLTGAATNFEENQVILTSVLGQDGAWVCPL